MTNFPGLPTSSTVEFSKGFQEALLTHLLHSAELFDEFKTVLRVDDFELAIYRVMFEALTDFRSRFGMTLDRNTYWAHCAQVAENVNGQFTSDLQPEEYVGFQGAFVRIVDQADASQLSPEYMRQMVPKYIQQVRSAKLMASYSPAIAAGQSPNELLERLTAVKEDSERAKATKPLFQTIQQVDGIMQTESDDTRISTGIQRIDRMLDGGLSLAEAHLGMVTATPGVGKTNTLIHFGTSAAQAGIRVLFVSLELPAKTIMKRYVAMTACVSGDLTKVPITQWPAAELARYEMVKSPNYPAWDYFCPLDFSDRKYDVAEIEAQIKAWKDYFIEKDGRDNCLLVCVDWLDHIKPVAGHGGIKNTRADESLTALCYELKYMAVRNGITLWTATQGTRDASDKAILGQKHTAGAFHKNDALDVAIGLGRRDPIALDDATSGARGEFFVMTLNKNRSGNLGSQTVYRAPTLRFYDEASNYSIHKEDMESRRVRAGDVHSMLDANREAGNKTFEKRTPENFDYGKPGVQTTTEVRQ
jgi:hypothetical protein